MEEKELLSAVEFSAESGIGLNKVYKMMADGTLSLVDVKKGIRKVNKIPRSELNKFQNK